MTEPRPRVQRMFPKLAPFPAPGPVAQEAQDALDGMVGRAEQREAARRRAAAVSAVVMIVALLLTSFGVGILVGSLAGAVAGIGAFAATMGTLLFIVGVLMGLNS